VWFNEGLAEYYSTFTPAANGKTAMLGRPIARHVLLLRERFLPIADLIAVDHGSPLYNEGERASIFYAESWALLHYLLKDDAWTLLSRAAQLSPNSFATQYALGTSFFRGRTGVMKAADSTDGRMTAARNALARAVELDPAAPDAWVWLANAHMLNETPDDARRAIERAVRLAPRRHEYRLLAARIAVAQGDTAAARSFIGDLAARADREDLVLQARDVLALTRAVGELREPARRARCQAGSGAAAAGLDAGRDPGLPAGWCRRVARARRHRAGRLSAHRGPGPSREAARSHVASRRQELRGGHARDLSS
jgi:tetratricopeptide (TPR) repeat protein